MPRGFAPSKKDATQPAIEEAFRRAGWSVCDVHAVGRNAPDLFVSKKMTTIAIECKTGRGRRMVHQVDWAEGWRGYYLTGNDPALLLDQAEGIALE